MSQLHPLWNGFQYFEHQVQGIEWMLEKERVGTQVPRRRSAGTECIHGGLQCDDMGLGKTIQVVSVLTHHIQEATLLIAPLAMIQTWTEVCERAGLLVFHLETQRHSTEWVCVNSDASLQDVRPHFAACRPEVYVTNYQKLYTQPYTFYSAWNRVVLDEAHTIRNPDGEMAFWARKLHAPIRWVVTGTPVVNSLRDVVSLLAFLGVPHSTVWRWEPHLEEAFAQLTLHRTLDALRDALPGAPPVPLVTEFSLEFSSEEEEEFYCGIQSSAAKYARDRLTAAEAFLLLLRLRQLSVHPQIYINAKRRETRSYDRGNWYEPSTKMRAVADILRRDHDDPSTVHRYLLFCQFNEEMDLFREFLLTEGLVAEENLLRYDGSLTAAQRTAILERSKATTDTTVMLLQIQAGGVGLNLQEYDRVIFVSPWWTAALRNQAVARAVRMGQTQQVHVYHLKLVMEDDETIVAIDALVNKKADEKQVILDKLFSLCGPRPAEEEEEEEEEDDEARR